MKFTGSVETIRPEILCSKDLGLGWHIRLTGSVGGWAAYIIIPFGGDDGARRTAEQVAETILEDIMREI